MAADAQNETIKVGMIGLDTSHVIAFAQILNDPSHPKHVPGAKVVAGFKGGSDDIESSYSRVDNYTKQLQEEFGLEIVDTIEELCSKVDAVLLESVDGRPKLEQIKPVLEAGKPVFIDKPMAGSLADAIAIARLAEEKKVPWFTSSSYRYYDSLLELKSKDVGDILSAISYGPCTLEPHHPDLFWYGIHPTEALYAVLGVGCESVVRTASENTDVVTGQWSDGRVGTLYGIRGGASPHQVILFGTKAVESQQGDGDYANLVKEIVQFFQTKVPPISAEETIEMFTFMEAADESKRQGGKPVRLSDVRKKAEESIQP